MIGPETYFVYGFSEKCAKEDKYITIDSFEVSATQGKSMAPAENAGLYITLGASTNLTADDFSNPNNSIELWISPSECLSLSFVAWDADSRKLVYEVAQSDSSDCSKIAELKIRSSEQSDAFPLLNVMFDIFDEYCVVDGTQYCGKYISLKLEYENHFPIV